MVFAELLVKLPYTLDEIMLANIVDSSDVHTWDASTTNLGSFFPLKLKVAFVLSLFNVIKAEFNP